jgi:hypothetical protein
MLTRTDVISSVLLSDCLFCSNLIHSQRGAFYLSEHYDRFTDMVFGRDEFLHDGQ